MSVRCKLRLALPLGGLALVLLTALAIAGTDGASGVSTPAPVIPVCPSSISFGETIQCSIDAPEEVDAYTFSGASGDRVRVRVLETSGSLLAAQEVLRPDGTTPCGGATTASELTCELDTNGTHTVLVKDSGGNDTGSYDLYLRRLNNPDDRSAPLNSHPDITTNLIFPRGNMNYAQDALITTMDPEWEIAQGTLEEGTSGIPEGQVMGGLVDDFVPQPVQEEQFRPRNRLGGDRGQIDGPGSGVVDWGQGVVTATITEGTNTQLGVWTSLNHLIDENLAVNFSAIFPPQIEREHQGKVTGLLVRVLDGQGTFKAELQAPDVTFPWSESVPLDGGQQEIQFVLPDDPPLEEIRNLNWVVVGGAGDFVAVDRVELIVELPAPATAERAFLWSYAMLLSNWDPASSLTRDSAKWMADDRDNVSASGMQAAASVLASDLGVISKAAAIEIVTNTAAGLVALPRCHGLWPHFVQGGQIYPEEEEEWSSIDTIFAIVALLEAQQALGIETAQIEQVLKDIDWAGLILPDGSISHGYNYDCSERLEPGWKDFGTESWLVNFGYASATGNVAEFDHEGPTFNGSGFIDELAWLLVPPPDRDRWETEWKAHSQEAANKQLGYYTDPDHDHECYGQLGLFGLSAAEVPDPSIVVDPRERYQAFGVGGTEPEPPNDGTALLGHAVIVPHYAGMIASLRPDEASALWSWMEGTGILTPLNNVESFMFIDEPACEEVVWNGLKGSWNLGLQTLGWGRLLMGSDNPLYAGLLANDILRRGYCRMSDPGSTGDVNCDGKVNVVDALFILQYDVGLRASTDQCPLPTEPPPPPGIGWLSAAACDVNCDGLCNVVDALFILQCEVGMPPGADMPFCLAAAQVTEDEARTHEYSNRR